MQERHFNKRQYFEEQEYTTQTYVIPFVEKFLKLNANCRVLEIGCGEGGNMKPFADMGCTVVGVDLSHAKIELGKEWFAKHPNVSKVKFISEDIYNVSDLEGGPFDLIFMRDVIEHIHDQEKFMSYLKRFLAPGGKVFFGFPPWYNPFGGHQQICDSKILSKMPYYHILPKFIYKGILKAFGETERRIDSLLEIKETGITIERFERILKREGYKIDRKEFYLINPNYEIKFKLKPRVQMGAISALPFARNFLTTAVYYLISNDK